MADEKYKFPMCLKGLITTLFIMKKESLEPSTWEMAKPRIQST